MKSAGRLWLPMLVTLAPLTGGCVATAVADAAVAVVKAPFQIAGAGVDAMTTSQEEADRNRGREERKAEEKAEKEAKKAKRQAAKLEDDEVTSADPR